MTRFMNPHFPTEHPGVTRAEVVAEKVQGWGHWMTSARGAATLLASAGVAAVIAVADQLIDTWADGHLLAAWAFLWAVAFLTLAVLAPAAKAFTRDFVAGIPARRARAVQERADEQFLANAVRDPRMAAELQAAIWRHEVMLADGPDADQATARAEAESRRAAMRLLRAGYYGHLTYL
jgi:hypothetical protein